LFGAASQTLLSFAQNPVHLGAIPGILSVLHTWGQQLSFHPHVHCIVSGGGITDAKKEVQWKNAKGNKNNFLFSENAMAIVYRAKYLQGLKTLIANNKVTMPPGTDMKQIIQWLYNKDWVVYAKKPFGGPQQVIEYLSRYTHKVAITNNRIKAVDSTTNTVTFDYKDYAGNGVQKQMQLTAREFIRRFEQHILPKHFTKIRSYGYLSNRNRKINISTILKHLKLPPHPEKIKIPWQLGLMERYHIHYNLCPHCKQPTLLLVAVTFKQQIISDG